MDDFRVVIQKNKSGGGAFLGTRYRADCIAERDIVLNVNSQRNS